MSSAKVRLCFVCLGNICRSPTAHGIMEHLVREAGLGDRIEVDSAGTGAWHVGEEPDRRSQAAARSRGFSLDSRARQFTASDFGRFDYVLAMDAENYRDLERIAPDAAALKKLHMFRSFDPASPKNAGVPDPYYGGPSGFDDVFDICEAACRGMLQKIAGDFGRSA